MENETTDRWVLMGDNLQQMILGKTSRTDENLTDVMVGTKACYLRECRIFQHSVMHAVDPRTGQPTGVQFINLVLPFMGVPGGQSVKISQPQLHLEVNPESIFGAMVMKALGECKQMEMEIAANNAGLVLAQPGKVPTANGPKLVR